MQGQLVENLRIVPVVDPYNSTGAITNSLWVNLKFWRRVAFVIHQGSWAGGTPAVTLNQATSNGGAGSKALAFTVQYSGTTNAQTANNDQLVKNTVTSNTFNLGSGGSAYNVIEVHAQDLDVANSFAWVQVSIASPGSNADFIEVMALLGDGSYVGLPSTIPSALG